MLQWVQDSVETFREAGAQIKIKLGNKREKYLHVGGFVGGGALSVLFPH